MNTKLFFLALILAVQVSAAAFAEITPTGSFRLPYNQDQAWTRCSTKGWAPYGSIVAHQYHMQYNKDFAKYHMGEDINGICGGDSDKGAPLNAIADGQVVYLDSVGNKVAGHGKEMHIRHSFPYSFATNDVMTLDSVIMHLDEIASGISWTGKGTGTTVTRGQTVAFLGGTGGNYSPHLHWVLVADLSLSAGVNPYQQPLLKDYALKYLAPSMVVDDRRILANLTKPTIGIWNQFTMVGNAPSSTAYVMLNGKRKSLRSAISQGWISSEGIRFESGGKFYYYKDVDQNFFEDGKRYQVKPLLSGVTIHIPIPQNKFQSDRARLDIIRAVKDDSRFQSVSTLSYEHDPKWHADWEMHTMSFAHRANYLMPIKQITNKKNPLLRYISINDPGTGKWSLWRKVDWNQLY